MIRSSFFLLWVSWWIYVASFPLFPVLFRRLPCHHSLPLLPSGVLVVVDLREHCLISQSLEVFEQERFLRGVAAVGFAVVGVAAVGVAAVGVGDAGIVGMVDVVGVLLEEGMVLVQVVESVVLLVDGRSTRRVCGVARPEDLKCKEVFAGLDVAGVVVVVLEIA